MTQDTLQHIQTLQYKDKEGAEALLLPFLRDTFPLDVVAVELRPSAISLNSFNGFLALSDGREYFFKTHTETDTVIEEYYNAEMLAQAGYAVIQPVYKSVETGKQLLIYERLTVPSVFDLAWEIENRRSDQLEQLTKAQNGADDRLFELFCATLEEQSAEDAEKSPIHQLFYHRLTGGRLHRFYGDASKSQMISFPNRLYSMSEIRGKHWVINGQQYATTLNDLIRQAIELLDPKQTGPSIIGHGDAHNGNVFFVEEDQTASLTYFDPAFAGRHHPLLDLVKPVFHNVFAMWMYFPDEINSRLLIQINDRNGTVEIEHDYTLPAIRQMFLESKFERVLIPTLQLLQQEGQLRGDWRAYFKAGLFCCPFLTMNLTDRAKFPPAISLLGMSMAIEMGSESHGKQSLIDVLLDEAEQSLS